MMDFSGKGDAYQNQLSPGEVESDDDEPNIVHSEPPPNLTSYLACVWMPDFPRKTKEALAKINQIYFSCKSKGQQWNSRHEPVKTFVDEYVLFTVYVDGNVVSRLNVFENLEVAQLIFSYLSTIERADDRQALFSTFFYIASSTNTAVLKTLSLTTSIALAARAGPFLECVATWMTEAGIDDRPVIYLAHDLFRDLVHLDSPEKYSDLPKVAPRFASVLIIAISKMFNDEIPPVRLIDQIIEWIEEAPSVCFVPPRSPIFELFKWSLSSEMDEGEKGIRLHVALLHALDSTNCGNQLSVVPQLMALMKDLDARGRKLYKLNKFHDREILKNLSNRFYQFLQMLIGAECLDQNEIQPILEECSKIYLPHTRFYKKLHDLYGHGNAHPVSMEM